MTPTEITAARAKPNLIADIGLALWGPQWQSQMARETGHDIRTVQRWAAGAKPRDKVYADLLGLMAARVSVLGGLISRAQSVRR